MKRIERVTFAVAIMLLMGAVRSGEAGPRPYARRPATVVYTRGHHSSGRTVAASLLAGVVLGSVLQNGYCEPPVRREVVYSRTVYQPATVQYVTPPTVQYVTPPTVQYVQPQPVVQYVPQPQATVQAMQPAASVAPQAPAAASEVVWIENSNGSKTPIELQRVAGGRYMGPRGEYYMQYPTEQQLRQVYGF